MVAIALGKIEDTVFQPYFCALQAPDQQVSLTDPDSRSMATSGRGSGVVGYNETLRVFARSLRTGSFFWPVKLPQVTVMRSMAILALLVALSTTADARHLPTNHLRHSFAGNVHRQASVALHRKVSSVSVQQDVEARPLQPIVDFFQKGLASIWSGGPTSDGKHVRPTDMACAHRTLPLGTVIHVTHERTKRSVLVTVRDRGPFNHGRILDLTPGAARALGFDHHGGVARVSVYIAKPHRAPKEVIYD
jgi:rare lipoprotein A